MRPPCGDDDCPGWMVEANTGEIQRCDLCATFETDDDAAQAWTDHTGRRACLVDDHWYDPAADGPGGMDYGSAPTPEAWTTGGA